jgi:hypothetical protein
VAPRRFSQHQSDQGQFFEPTVLADVTEEMLIAQEACWNMMCPCGIVCKVHSLKLHFLWQYLGSTNIKHTSIKQNQRRTHKTGKQSLSKIIDTPSWMVSNSYFRRRGALAVRNLYFITINSWNTRQPEINGCFPTVVKNPYITHGSSGKPPLTNLARLAPEQ